MSILTQVLGKQRCLITVSMLLSIVTQQWVFREMQCTCMAGLFCSFYLHIKIDFEPLIQTHIRTDWIHHWATITTALDRYFCTGGVNNLFTSATIGKYLLNMCCVYESLFDDMMHILFHQHDMMPTDGRLHTGRQWHCHQKLENKVWT